MKKSLIMVLIIFYIFIFGELFIRLLDCSQVTDEQFIEAKGELDRIGRIKMPRDASLSVLVAGDSLIAGYGVNDNDKFTSVLQKSLAGHFITQRTEVTDATLNGSKINKKCDIFDKIINDAGSKKPNFFLLQYNLTDVYKALSDNGAGNITAENDTIANSEYKDIIHLYKYVLYQSRLVHFISSRTSFILKNNGIILKWTEFYHLQNKAYAPDYPGWINAQKRILETKNKCDLYNITFVIFLPDISNFQSRLLKKDIETFSGFCVKNTITFIDCSDWFKNMRLTDIAISKFDNHPNYKAHKILGEKMAQIVIDLIQRKPHGLSNVLVGKL